MLLILFFWLSGISGFAFAQETIRITNGEWPPYLSEKLKHNGLASRIVREAFELEGIQVVYDFFPWNRSLMLAQTGEWDGTAVWLRSPEREQEFYISDPVVQSTYVFFHLKKRNFSWKTLEDLKDYRIGGTFGYDYGEAFQKAEKEKRIRVERASRDELNLAKLLHERIDIFPLDINVGYTLLVNEYPPEVVSTVTVHPLALRDDPLHLLLSRKVPENKTRMEKFNSGLKKLYESGKIDQYLEESRRGEYKP
jgi:polar amino acid transport system substrate-binding protein